MEPLEVFAFAKVDEPKRKPSSEAVTLTPQGLRAFVLTNMLDFGHHDLAHPPMLATAIEKTDAYDAGRLG
ncbi:hypothetical protein HYQ46_003263 [Verticillium longisporum]|nr:hypothetical protein HYQ46_003263 [Verticillium longisporum]